MTPPSPLRTSDEPAAADVAGSLEILGLHLGIGSATDVLIASGMSRSTAYRRIANLDEMSRGEMRSVSRRVHVPVHVIEEGRRAVMRWLLDNEDRDPDGDPAGLPGAAILCFSGGQLDGPGDAELLAA